MKALIKSMIVFVCGVMMVGCYTMPEPKAPMFGPTVSFKPGTETYPIMAFKDGKMVNISTGEPPKVEISAEKQHQMKMQSLRDMVRDSEPNYTIEVNEVKTCDLTTGKGLARTFQYDGTSKVNPIRCDVMI